MKLAVQELPDHTMPDVTGMGASDAVFLLETCGLKVKLNGAGKVKSQSIPYGANIHHGMICQLILQ